MQMHTNSLNPHLKIQDWALYFYLGKRGGKIHNVLEIRRQFFWLTQLTLFTNYPHSHADHRHCGFWSAVSCPRTLQHTVAIRLLSSEMLPLFQMPRGELQLKSSLCSLAFVRWCTDLCSISQPEAMVFFFKMRRLAAAHVLFRRH